MLKSDLRTKEELKAEEQRLQKWQTQLNQTDGFNKFPIQCKICGKPKLMDASDPETKQKLRKTFGNTVHTECRIKNQQLMPLVLRPISFSGVPVPPYGFSPNIQFGPGVGFFHCSGEPFTQSGYSKGNYFVTKDPNKNTENGFKSSS